MRADLPMLGFRIGETDEDLAVKGLKRRRRPSPTAPLTVEQIIHANERRPWVNGATYLDAEQAGLDDATIIDLLYRDTLGRRADPGGLAHYVQHRREGTKSFDDIRRNLVESEEYRGLRWPVSQAPGSIFSQAITLLAASAATAAEERIDVEVPMDSALFGSGWHREEDTHGPTFRWMQATGVIISPMARLPCGGVVLNLCAVYGSHEPMLRAFLDDREALVAVAVQEGGFEITIEPPERRFMCAKMLRLESLASGCPLAEGRGTDDRVLSISVDRARWSFLAET
jgi:hypothetical protein